MTHLDNKDLNAYDLKTKEDEIRRNIIMKVGNMNADDEEDRADDERTEDEETEYEDENDDRWMRKRRINVSMQSMMNVVHELESENKDLRNEYLEKPKEYEEQQLAVCIIHQVSEKNNAGQVKKKEHLKQMNR